MAIQRLGSSLIAKSQSGSRLRSAEEDRQTGALQRGSASAQTGSPVRGSVDEPIEKLNPQGTQKIVSVQPSITPTEKSVVSKIGIAPSIGAASRVSNPSGVSNGGGTGKASNPGGGAAPASRTAFRAAQVGASTSGIGRPAIGYTPGGGGASGSVKGASTQGSVSRVTNPTQLQSQGLVKSLTGLGNRVSAGETTVKPVIFKPTTAIKGAVGKAIDTVGRSLGNPLPEKKISENLQSATMAQAKKASNTAQNVAKAINNAPAALRSAASNVAQKASNTVQNVIRSLTKKK